MRNCTTLYFVFFLSSLATAAELTTIAERSNYVETGRYDEVQTLCSSFQSAFPKQVRCINFGTTPQGRPMLALVASSDATFTPELTAQRKRPVVLVQGGIHSGEIDGKDAGFRVMRDLLQGSVLTSALSKITLVFVPVFNIDGHERFGPNNRPNQNGPREMGFRATAQNLNLNRDYMKADAPEMRAMLKLLSDFDPVVYADLHVTDGADFQHDVSITMEPTRSQDEKLQKIGQIIQKSVISDLNQKGAKALDFYPNLLKEDDPAQGFAVSVPPPRFSHGYWGARGRFGVLVETHSWKAYKTRVQRTYDAVISLVEQSALQGDKWLEEFKNAEARDKQLGGKTVVLSYKNGEHVSTIDFQGYAYSRTPSAISGGIRIRYDRSKPELWHIPLKDTVVPDVSITAPKAGYFVPSEWSELVANRLTLHGIEFRRIVETHESVAASVFRASKMTWPKESFEGRMPLGLEGAWEQANAKVSKGSLFVPISQAKARLLMALLEPLAPDSMARWGDFNAVFERKEYIESYVAEDFANTMLAKDPALRQEFIAKLEADKSFAADPGARLDFFYKRHPSWDTHYAVYPILRIDRLD